MDRFVKAFRRRSPVEEMFEENANEETPESTSAAEMAVVPEGYKLLNLQQPDGTFVAVRRKMTTWQVAHRDSLMSSRSSSPVGSSNGSGRAAGGRLVAVQRPVRDSAAAPSRGTSQISQTGSAPKKTSFRSSLYSWKAERDTMASTMTIVDAALADQLSSQTRRHSRRDGSAVTTVSGTAISGTSGDIHIGHIEEGDENDVDSEYSASDYDERQENHSEDEETGDDTTRSGCRKSYGSCAFRDSKWFNQHQLGSFDAKELPSPPSTAYHPSQDTTSWGCEARLRAYERYALQSQPQPSHKRHVWVSWLIQASSYFMACCSIILSAMFLVLGIVATFMNGRTVSSGWSAVDSVFNMAAAIWPVAFAAVAAQCFKAWILFNASRWNSSCGQIRGSMELSRRLEVICLLVFLVWCLSPLGSQGLERAYGISTKTQQSSTDVWYVDRTGYNPIWSANSTNTMSAADRSELVQIISEKYISSLAPSTKLSDQNGPTNSYSLPTSMLSNFVDSNVNSKGNLIRSSSHISLRDLGGNQSLEPIVESPVETLRFSMVTSYFEFTCGNWSLTQRNFANTTSATNMWYSNSQTLGMSMASVNDSSTSIGTVTFASLNKISPANSTILARKAKKRTLSLNETWEYSSIQCRFEQYFYSEPIQCERDQSTSTGACVQSGSQSLMLTSKGLSGTDLGDFAQDFVSANLPTTGREATATERYVQNGGSINPTSLVVKRDEPVLLNLSATVSPTDFAQSFGHLFNTWVSLGYCPQCTSDVLAGNDTVIPATLQPFYRQITTTTVGVGDQVFTINWAWLTVFLTFATCLLMAAVISVAVGSIASTGSASNRKAAAVGKQGGRLVELQLPKTYSTATSSQRSPQWSEGVMQDIEAAAVADAGHIHR